MGGEMNQEKEILPNKFIRNILLILFIDVLLFQNPLSRLLGLFSYTDEVIAVAGIGAYVYRRMFVKRQVNDLRPVVFLCGFVLTGVLGNVIFQYQPVKLVFIDLLTNIKFFFAVLFGEQLETTIRDQETRKLISLNLRIFSAAIFILLIIEQVFHIFPEFDIRHGIRSACLIYEHPTYLAASLSAAIAFLTCFYERKNRIYIIFNLITVLFTMRTKAFLAAAAYCAVVYYVIIKKREPSWKEVLAASIGALALGARKVYYYFIFLDMKGARSILTRTAFRIMKDYFPIGTGFGTYGSHVAGQYYSPVYVKYGFESYYELRNSEIGTFFDDSFWPIIIGQTGLIGTVFYFLLLLFLFWRVWNTKKVGIYEFAGGMFCMAYLFISSLGESAFNNALACPFAVLIGVMLASLDRSGKMGGKHLNRSRRTGRPRHKTELIMVRR